MPDKRQHILLSEAEGKQALCFDTGLEPRSFARTKMSQSMIEKGYLVKPDGSHEVWTSSGVTEFGNHMRVWGKPVGGRRFDQIIDDINFSGNSKTKLTVLNSLVSWIRAKLFLGDIYTTLNPAAVFIDTDGSVFFSPPNLANRCLYVEGKELDPYNCPDLTGNDAVAFCAGVILYKILTGNLPYSDEKFIFQDMREGVYVPPHIAYPGLKKELCDLIKEALSLPLEKKPKTEKKNALDILSTMLKILTAEKGDTIAQISDFYNQLTPEEIQKQEKDKKSFVSRQNVKVKVKRFAVRNKYPLIGTGLALAFVLFVVFTTVAGAKRRPTTDGMLSDSVVYTYYSAFSSLDHTLMDACTQGSDSVIKSDINAAAAFYAIAKTRQSYENTANISIIPARVWQDSGGELPAPNVFGTTDLSLEHLAGSDRDGLIIYRARYLLWSPNEHARNRTDTLTLRLDRKKNWRITEIIRTEQ